MIITKNSTTPEALRETMLTTQSMFRVAAIQMASGPNVLANLQEAARLIELAAATGARIIALPEYFCILGRRAHTLTGGPAAREHRRVGGGAVRFPAAAAGGILGVQVPWTGATVCNARRASHRLQRERQNWLP